MSTTSLRSFEYLEKLPETAFKRLYAQPSTALAIFRRFLPHIAKTFIMAMLFLNDPLPVADLDTWVRPDSKREQENAMYVLERLKILSTVQEAGQIQAYRITNPFCTSLRMALTGGGDHRSFGVPGGVPEAEKLSMKLLAEFARQQWEAILYYVVGSSESAAGSHAEPSDGAKQLLQAADFVRSAGRVVEITANGFTFLLQEINTQVWSLLIEYLEFAEENLSLDNVEVLSFLFTVGSLEVGQDYSTTTLTSVQKNILTDLHDFGIVYWPSQDDTYFYPTPLASAITSDSSLLASASSKTDSLLSMMGTSSNQTGFIVIETNYRIYAYTSSPLQIQILSLFTRLSTRYPNMISGRLTKESIQYAINRGITSQQIISYLTAHAHPIMTSNSRSSATKSGYAATQQSILPPTVVDQIRLWQIEGDRMNPTPGFLFKDFADAQEYEELVNYADAIGVLVWRSNERRLFFATKTDHLEKFIVARQNRKKQAAEVNGTGRSS